MSFIRVNPAQEVYLTRTRLARITAVLLNNVYRTGTFSVSDPHMLNADPD